MRTVLGVQAAYYMVTGLWPFFSFATFELVTGPKVDRWLVLTVGLLIAVVGLALAVAAARDEIALPVLVLAFGMPAAFAAIEIRFAGSGRIRKVYLLDALAQSAMAAALAILVASR
jgi:hypothetical protein